MTDGPHDRHTISAVALLHMENLDQGFLAKLGVGFLTEMYGAIDRCSSSVLLVAKDEQGNVAGFVSGSKGMRPIYLEMLRRFFVLPFVMMPTLLNPVRIWRIGDILFYSFGKDSKFLPSSRTSEKNIHLPENELLSIAVAPHARGKGVSESLYSRLVAHFRTQRETSFRIIVGEKLEPAHRFYRRMGAEVAGTIEVHKGELSKVYVQRLHCTA